MTMEEEIQEIQNYLLVTLSGDDSDLTLQSAELVNFGNTLVAYLGRITELQMQAKYGLNKCKKSETMNIVRDFIFEHKFSAKVQNALIDGLCADEQKIVDWLEDIRSTIVHDLDWCRTMISRNKEEMRLSNLGKEFR